ncbi:MAG: DUF4391 domain-containing protein [Thermoflexales bacterium]|nr:DUF4391 domain-containing protein [Thermoflexales bacterium]
MNATALIATLDLPPNTRVERRVPKTLLLKNAAPTAADKRLINDGIEDMLWVATLKPANIGVPAFDDDLRAYVEIAVLRVTVRAGAHAERLATLIHRAVPHPVLLIVADGTAVTLSLAHQRLAQGKADARVLDDAPVAATLNDAGPGAQPSEFIAALSLARQPRADLYQLYQGWTDTVVAALAAAVTGRFSLPASPEQAARRRAALGEWHRLDAEGARLRAAARNEKQIARRVALNLALADADAARKRALADL